MKEFQFESNKELNRERLTEPFFRFYYITTKEKKKTILNTKIAEQSTRRLQTLQSKKLRWGI